MSRGHMSNEDFIVRLTELFESRHQKQHGSVFLTQKRHPFLPSVAASQSGSYPTPAPSPGNLDDLQPPPEPLPILIRATNGKSSRRHDNSSKTDNKPNTTTTTTAAASSGGGSDHKKTKISTIVMPDDLEPFFTRYAEVCKVGMQALKKRDRSGRKKAGKKAKKRKGGGEGGGGESTVKETK
ncbi:MAG: hypothetical protein M1837_004878 [Sclerophora amabilis]|nr:MAG: hypothetical protein M1837_004878 [Sclerophora amabilis]